MINFRMRENYDVHENPNKIFSSFLSHKLKYLYHTFLVWINS